MKKTCAITYWNTGHGITSDISAICSILQDLGFKIKLLPTQDRRNQYERVVKHIKQSFRYFEPYFIQIHLEQIHPEQFRFSNKNILIPNPEFTDPDVFRKCKDLRVIICKTRSGEKLLSQWHTNCIFTGFKSEDRFDASVEKDYAQCLIVEGRNEFRGSKRVVEIWNQHPEWPELTVIRNPVDVYGNQRWKHQVSGKNILIIEDYLPTKELKKIQNECGTHICLSESEGFGHAINEALSTKAVVFTTDAPPMNELVTSNYGILVPHEKTATQFMEKRYFFDQYRFTNEFESYLETNISVKQNRGQAARKRFLDQANSFQRTFANTLKSIAAV